MYGSKVGVPAATGLGVGAAVSSPMGPWFYTFAALAALAVVLLVRGHITRRRHMALGMVGNGNISWRKRMHMRRRG